MNNKIRGQILLKILSKLPYQSIPPNLGAWGGPLQLEHFHWENMADPSPYNTASPSFLSITRASIPCQFIL
jgi:hypothetical protein